MTITDGDIVVGGGISGLVAALLLAEREGRRVSLIEREAALGGLLRSFDYGPQGQFDYGMHTMFDTGVVELDQLLFGLLPEDEWQVGEGIQRDLAGLFLGGRLQTNSPYVDLRLLPTRTYEQCVADFFLNLSSNRQIDETDARSYAVSRYGESTASVLTSAIEKIYGRDPSQLDVMATRITPFDRVVMFDESLVLDLMKSDVLRARIAFPEQRNLPPGRGSGRRTFYPRAYGIHRVVQALQRRLEKAGVEIRTRSEVRSVSVEGGVINTIQLSDGSSLPVSRLYWTSGLPPLARVLGLSLPPEQADPPRRTVIVNMLVDAPLDLDLHYFYCYEPGFRTFRLTNFTAYCEGAPRAGQFPLTMELLVDEGDTGDPAALERRALDELRAFGVLPKGASITFVRVEILVTGFPMPSRKAIGRMSDLRDAIRQRRLTNLTTMGVLSERGLFFQRDVLADTYQKVAALLAREGGSP